ncbi:MAG TPA: YIP1 family protein [Prolixibacteraceae bacterium]|nr:YIP1 family protein [Prolixibacteraceae bacterium]HPS12980.1 YIP1 family protein [Prolixibacteraceae bacterium]
MKLPLSLKGILDECLSFFLRPRTYWQQIKTGKRRGAFSFKRFFIPALIIAFFFTFIGYFVFHLRDGFLWKEALVMAFKRIILIFLLLFLSVWVTKMVMGWFKITIKGRTVRNIAVYSLSPVLLTSICTGLLPFLDLGGVAPWYGLYLAYTGLETFFIIPEKKKFYFYFVLFMAVFMVIMTLTFALRRISLLIIG